MSQHDIIQMLKDEIDSLQKMSRDIEQTVTALQAAVQNLENAPVTAPNAPSPYSEQEDVLLGASEGTIEHDSEFDNISISTDFIRGSNFRDVIDKHFHQSEEIKHNLVNIIDGRLKATKDTEYSKGLMTSFNQSDRNPEQILEKKMKIINSIQENLQTILDLLDSPPFNSTILLDVLDNLYEIDEFLFEVNSRAQTPTEKGPIIFLIRDINRDTLDFIKEAVIHNQNRPK